MEKTRVFSMFVIILMLFSLFPPEIITAGEKSHNSNGDDEAELIVEDSELKEDELELEIDEETSEDLESKEEDVSDKEETADTNEESNSQTEEEEQVTKEEDSEDENDKSELDEPSSDEKSNSSISVFNVTESKISKLGHINSSSVKIYPNLDDLTKTITAGSTYTHHVYYIKREAEVNGEIYYQLRSRENDATFGYPGWVKASDMNVRDHTVVDKKAKTFTVKGSSSAYNHAWGGRGNYAYSDLSSYKGSEFKVHLTEKVGNAIWYRGTLDGKTVWIHSSHVTENINPTKTSKLGHINSASVKIYSDLNNLSKSITAGSTYTHHVYYIKQEAEVNGEIYYQLRSRENDATFGYPGWVKASDMNVRDHTVVDKKSKTFYVKGTSSAYNHAWGGRGNYAYSDLSSYKGSEFKVHLTEKVGNVIWYRGTLGGKTVWIHSSHVVDHVETKTSKLGHINSSSVKIYQDLSDLSKTITAGSTYTHHVYYIKREAEVNGEIYYQLRSRENDETFGYPGWVKASDMNVRDHTVVDKKAKTFSVKGSSSAYNHAWGGRANYAFSNLAPYKGSEFKVHLTEKVGNDIWYRGTLDGKVVWIHSSHLSDLVERKTSKLGHINSSTVKIYTDINNLSKTITAGSTYTHHVYYIKREADINGEKYYQLRSRENDATFGYPGWVKASDMNVRDHTVVDKKAKTFYVKGSSSAYNHAWGGRANYAYSSLSSRKGNTFNVHLTEKVGNTTWYRGTLDGRTVWISSLHVTTTPLKQVSKTHKAYDLTLDRMADIQMKVTPQTDTRYKLWLREDAFSKGSISNGKGTVRGSNWNLRRGPGTNFTVGGKVNGGDVLTIYTSTKGSDGYTWYHVRNTSGWVIPDRADLIYNLNPNNFTSNFRDSLQFLDLGKSANIDVAEVNEKILKGKGILASTAGTFVEAGKIHGVNEIYLISHALLETGNGRSELATGVKHKGKTVYNMYGIGAKDSCPLKCGTEYAYNAGWFTPELAIIGGAAFVSNNYLARGQNTLYKMRWNPEAAASTGRASHQYATDIGWARKQTVQMNALYNMLDGYSIHLEIPEYR